MFVWLEVQPGASVSRVFGFSFWEEMIGGYLKAIGHEIDLVRNSVRAERFMIRKIKISLCL